MNKTAFVFAGQGAQLSGMMQDICMESHSAAEIMDIADKALKRDITSLCFAGTQEELNLTHNTQPCVLAADLAAAAALMENGILPDGTAGFSLGEYAALTVAGAIRKEDVFPLIQIRADAMQSAAPVGTGFMAAVGLSGEETEKICCQIKDEYVEISNYNNPEQTVVAGTEKGVKQVMELAEQVGARSMIIPMSVPSHCSLMQPASATLSEALEKVPIYEPSLPLYMNRTARRPEPGSLKELMAQQLCSPLLWKQTIERMYEDGFDTFVECGPGRTLSKLIKKILTGKEVFIYRAENSRTLHQAIQELTKR